MGTDGRLQPDVASVRCRQRGPGSACGGDDSEAGVEGPVDAVGGFGTLNFAGSDTKTRTMEPGSVICLAAAPA